MIRTNLVGVKAVKRQRDDHGRYPMSALGGPAVHESLHEIAQALRLERTMLHFVHHEVVGRLRQLLALFIAAAGDADVVDRLAGHEELDHLVDALWLAVIGVSALRRQQRREGDSEQCESKYDALHLDLVFQLVADPVFSLNRQTSPGMLPGPGSVSPESQ